jgi:hypothetical protein
MPLAIAAPKTDIEIISQACSLCGKSSFNTIEAGGPFARDAAAFYGTLVTSELGSNRWRFSQHWEEMAVLTTISPDFEGWQYYWEMPADLLMFFRVDPVGNDWQVFGSRVLTRTNQNLKAVYSRAVPVSKWPPAFCMYIIYALADMLATSITNSDRMVLRIQANKNMWEQRALFADGQNSPVRSMRSIPWINARFAFWNGGPGGFNGGNF